MNFQDILFQTFAGVATVTLNRPERLNAFRSRTLIELTQALEEAGRDKTVGVVILTGAGNKAFSVGGDIHEMKKFDRRSGGLFAKKLVRLAKTLLIHPKPIIAKVNGYCLGGGNELQLFCDLTVASDRSSFGQTGPKVGSVPLWGGTQLLPLVVGMKRAHEIIFLCHQYPAREAKEMGLINRVVPEIGLDAAVAQLAQEILGKSPQSIALSRQALHEGILPRIERDLKKLTKIYGSAELKEGMKSFLEKRNPNFPRF